jgi:hypothetical protein
VCEHLDDRRVKDVFRNVEAMVAGVLAVCRAQYTVYVGEAAKDGVISVSTDYISLDTLAEPQRHGLQSKLAARIEELEGRLASAGTTSFMRRLSPRPPGRPWEPCRRRAAPARSF